MASKGGMGSVGGGKAGTGKSSPGAKGGSTGKSSRSGGNNSSSRGFGFNGVNASSTGNLGFGGGSLGGFASTGGGSFGGFGGGGSFANAPDIGSLGGNFADASGETSATLGGSLTGAQADANAEVNRNSFGYGFGSARMSTPGVFDRFDLGNLIGAQFSQGLPATPAPAAYDPSPTFSSVMDSPIGRVARSLLGMVNPVAGGLLGAGYAASQGDTANALGQAVGALTQNGLLGAGATIATRGLQGEDVRGDVGSLVGGVAGSMLGGQAAADFGGPIAGQIGSQLGGQFGSQLGYNVATGQGATQIGRNMNTGYAPQTGGGGTGVNRGDLLAAGLGALGSIYVNNRARKDAQSNVTDLGSMFGPDSAYAQQLRQQLERRDAAAGRRSQYGPREVELQARLAELAARSAPQISQANMQAQQVANQRQAQTLNTLYALGRDSGLFNWAGNQLGNLFNRPQPTYVQPVNNNVSYANPSFLGNFRLGSF